MLKRRIIPCLDIKDGRVVKGVHFAGLRDPGDPVEASRAYDLQGADEICLIDTSGTSEGHAGFVEVVRRVSAQLFVSIMVGGGIRREDDARRLIHAGADKVAINSAAVANPSMIQHLAEQHGTQAIVGFVDVRRLPQHEGETEPLYEVMIHGGVRSTGLDVLHWCRQLAELGAGEIVINSTDRDGTRDGFDLWITQQVARAVPVPVIASGGVGSLENLREGLATGYGEADAALAATIFHFGLFTIAQAKRYLLDHNIPVRPPEAVQAGTL